MRDPHACTYIPKTVVQASIFPRSKWATEQSARTRHRKPRKRIRILFCRSAFHLFPPSIKNLIECGLRLAETPTLCLLYIPAPRYPRPPSTYYQNIFFSRGSDVGYSPIHHWARCHVVKFCISAWAGIYFAVLVSAEGGMGQKIRRYRFYWFLLGVYFRPSFLEKFLCWDVRTLAICERSCLNVKAWG